ncbi:MAG: hypothetical protein K8R68_06655, partial [Bacteroidales bacterium]|nr:hypothetical protein [Bacteroidales bacterium]
MFTAIIVNIQYGFAEIPPLVDLETDYTVHNGHIVYLLPEADYANIIKVGPGQTYEEIHDIPMNDLTDNTLVEIYYRSEPYRTKTLIETGGTENAHLRIQGVPDANGNLPVITAENATLFGNFNEWTEELGVFVVCGPYGSKPAWVEFVNLHIKDGEYAGIWIKGDHISVKGCILENNPNGVFFQATNQLMIEISSYNLIEGCRFIHNGIIDSWFQHNIYSQGYKTVIQFNTIEKLQDGAFGSSLKDRSAHTVIRYNYIETSSRTIDLVEPEDTDEVLMNDDDWDDAYVYGNLIINEIPPAGVMGTSMIHYGYDNEPGITREGTLFFANNTVIIDRDDNPWRINLFDINSINALVNFKNNITVA